MKKIIAKLIGQELTARLGAETPSFFKKIRTIGIVLGAIGGAIAVAPIALPAIVITYGTYAVFIGGTMVLVAQTAVVDASALLPKE